MESRCLLFLVNISCRLHLRANSSHQGGWVTLTDDQNQWLQVQFGQRVEIKRVATQGRQNAVQWVKSYTLNYSTDGVVFNQYKTNTDQTVSGVLERAINTVLVENPFYGDFESCQRPVE